MLKMRNILVQKPELYTKDGWLTPYALACGYLEVNEGWKEKRIACMEMDSACFHVKAYNSEECRDYWESFITLGEARKAYKEQLKLRGAKRTIHK